MTEVNCNITKIHINNGGKTSLFQTPISNKNTAYKHYILSMLYVLYNYTYYTLPRETVACVNVSESQ